MMYSSKVFASFWGKKKHIVCCSPSVWWSLTLSSQGGDIRSAAMGGQQGFVLAWWEACAQHDVVAVPVCLLGTSSGSWFVLNKGAEIMSQLLWEVRCIFWWYQWAIIISLSSQMCGSKVGYLRCFSCKLNTTYIMGRAAGPSEHLEIWKVPLALQKNCFAKAHSIKV